MKKILVIDDEKPTLGMFRLFLGAYGYQVLTAENGLAGIGLFEQEKPSIVITDIKMPGMDGFEVLQRIKEIDPSTEVIVITGHGDMDLAIQALNLNATDFINKPIQKTALDAALSRAEERLRSSAVDGGEITLKTVEEIPVIDIRGKLTSRSEPLLQEIYEKASSLGTAKIILNFDENTSVNGAGIAILIQLLTESKRRNQTVAMSGLTENFRKVFTMVGITKFAGVFDTESDALAALRGKGEP